MRKTVWMIVAALVLSVGLVSAQSKAPAKAPQPSPGPSAELLGMWNGVGNKLIRMAEDFPEDKYDFKPKPEVRTFAEQLLHVAGSNLQFVSAAQGKPLGPEDLPRAEYKTKAAVVAALKKSVSEGAAIIQQWGDAGLAKQFKFPYGNRMVTGFAFWADPTEHMGEHYGQLVVYYRVNGMVPPESRPRPR